MVICGLSIAKNTPIYMHVRFLLIFDVYPVSPVTTERRLMIDVAATKVVYNQLLSLISTFN